MFNSQRITGLLFAAGFSVLSAAGCGSAETKGTSATGATGGSSSASTTTGSGGAGGDATSSSSTASSSASGTGGGVMLGDIDVTVTYAGAMTGTLNVAAITMFPPMGPPVAFQSVMMPKFPASVKLIGLEVPKDYYIVAVLDIGSNNPQNPGPEDLVAVTMPAVKATAGAAAKVDLVLKDKP